MTRGMLTLFLAVALSTSVYGSNGQVHRAVKSKTLTTKLAAALFAAGIFFGGVQAVQAQEEAQQEVVDWQVVDEMSEAYLHNTQYLLGMDMADPDASPLMMHALYVGENSDGDSLLMGFYLKDLKGMEVDLYGYDGVIAKNVELVEHKFFTNHLSPDDNIQIYALRDLNMSDSYTAAKLENYPFTKIGRPLQLATYGLSEEEITDYVALNLQRRSCSSRESLGWARIGYGLNTCSATGENFGATIYNSKTGNAMGIWAGKGRHDWLMIEYLDEVIEEVNGLQEESLAVDAKGKLPTLWAKLKMDN